LRLGFFVAIINSPQRKQGSFEEAGCL